MNQTRLGSLIEAAINTAIGFVGSILLSLIVYPLFGHSFTIAQNVGITVIFTVWSIVRNYSIRRWFNSRIHAAAQRIAASAS
jgi:hypothetical protein